MNKIVRIPAVVLALVLLHAGEALAGPLVLNSYDRDVSDMTVRERFFVGGFVGLQFGTFTAVSLNLHAGYLITNNISAGAGGIYQYTNDNLMGTSYSSHVYGASAFARFNVYSGLFVHTEYERLRLKTRLSPFDFDPGSDPDDRTTISENNYFIGAGYGIRMSDRLTLNLLLLYNLNENSHVYMDNPFFRVGVDIFM